MKFTQEQYIRYSRQLILPEVQGEGQQKILEAKVLLVGLGGLGSPQVLYLAAAGVGTLGVVDGDRVDLTNLQRQVAHSSDDLGSPKVVSAERRIRALNPDVCVHTHDQRLDARNAMDLLSGYDIIVDCTDNFPARYLLSDACVFLKKPLVHGAIYRFEGQTTVFHPDQGGPCYRCLFPVPPAPGTVPSCAESGVLGILPGVVGLFQANEVMKLVLGKGRSLIGRLLFCNLLATQFQELEIRKDPKCPACGEDPSITELMDYEVFCGLRETEREDAGRDRSRGLRVVDLDRRIRAGDSPLFLDVREEWERSIYPFEEGFKVPFSRLASEWESLVFHRDQEIVVCCLFGWRSREAVEFLVNRGFDRLFNLEGGLEELYLLREQTRAEKEG